MTLSQLADISTVWLAFLCFIGMLIPLAVTYFAIRGMNQVLGKTPGVLKRAQSVSRTVRDRTQMVSSRVAEPMIRTQGAAVKTETTVRKLLADDKTRSPSTEAKRES